MGLIDEYLLSLPPLKHISITNESGEFKVHLISDAKHGKHFEAILPTDEWLESYQVRFIWVGKTW